MNQVLQKSGWLQDPAIKPYLFVRPENHILNPGSRHHLNWFSDSPIYKNPIDPLELPFAEQIYFIEREAFGPSNLAMPRWVFYDCAIIPGFVAGFCISTKELRGNPKYRSLNMALAENHDCDWTPLSLFIIIPTVAKGVWVAHNLCSVNSLLAPKDQIYGLGFLSKAFGLWYANVERCLGMTQWGSAALKLHSHYGHLQIVSAYTPVHTLANTLTYQLEVNPNLWEQFFTRESDLGFLENYAPAGFEVVPKDEASLRELHHKILTNQDKYFLSAHEIGKKSPGDPLTVYRSKLAMRSEDL